MPRISNIEILQQNGQPTLSIFATSEFANLPHLIGSSYAKLGEYLKTLGEEPVDIPFVAYRNPDPRQVDVEIGFPVARPLPGKGEIQSSEIPAGKVAFCMYLGAYDKIGPVYGEMTQWIKAKGFEEQGVSYEYYYNGEEFPEDKYLTRLVMPFI